MDTVTTLEFIAFLLGCIGAIWSFLLVVWKRKAQIEFKRKLQSREFLDKIERLRGLMDKLSTESPDLVKMHEAQLLLEEPLMSLEKSQRKLILEGLRQPSIKGQARYIAKLVNDTFDSAPLEAVLSN